MREYIVYIEEIDLSVLTKQVKKLIENIFYALRKDNMAIWLEYDVGNGRCELHTVLKNNKDTIIKLAKEIKKEYKRLDKITQDLNTLGVEVKL